MRLDYQLLDVFTTTPLAGNQLAVVLNADSLLDNQMQAIAVEFGLSETVFLCKPQHERHTSAVRIFTATRELLFAGHPTIGAAAVVLALQHRLTAVRIEEQVGLITCLVDKIDKRTAHARFALPQLPEEATGKPPGKAALALALGVNLDELGCGEFQPAVYSAGVLYYLVPVRNAEVLARLKLDLIDWNFTFPLGNHAVYCFTRTEGEEGVDFAARMFAPRHGHRRRRGHRVGKAAALIGLLAKHTSFADGQVEYQIRQGKEMGAPQPHLDPVAQGRRRAQPWQHRRPRRDHRRRRDGARGLRESVEWYQIAGPNGLLLQHIRGLLATADGYCDPGTRSRVTIGSPMPAYACACASSLPIVTIDRYRSHPYASKRRRRCPQCTNL